MKRPSQPKLSSTRERILETSRLLFNEEGLQASAVYRVAAAMRISAGNLNYHFKTKIDIADALADRFEETFVRLTARVDQLGVEIKLVDLMTDVLTLIWRYRFLFESPQYLHAIDQQLAMRLRSLRTGLRNLIRQTTRHMIETGVLRAPRGGDGDILADNIVATWIYWLQMQDESLHADSDQPDPESLVDCIQHHFGLLEPYLSSNFAKKFLHDLKERFPVAATPPEAIKQL